jgi:pimeloyl-ACP methyl ester carboxylesterase
MSDVMTDLSTNLTQFPGTDFFVHDGILRGAQGILAAVGADLESALASLPSYNIVVCGHSLGAAASILVAMLIVRLPPESACANRKVECFAFGSPPLFSADSAQQRSSQISNRLAIVNVFNAQDLVPRLSLWSGDRLLHRLDKLDALTKDGRVRRLSRYWATFSGTFAKLSLPEREAVLDALRLHASTRLHNSKHDDYGENFRRLYHPDGVVFHFQEENVLTIGNNVDHFPADIEVNGTKFLVDHLPNKYNAALRSWGLFDEFPFPPS